MQYAVEDTVNRVELLILEYNLWDLEQREKYEAMFSRSLHPLRLSWILFYRQWQSQGKVLNIKHYSYVRKAVDRRSELFIGQLVLVHQLSFSLPGLQDSGKRSFFHFLDTISSHSTLHFGHTGINALERLIEFSVSHAFSCMCLLPL